MGGGGSGGGGPPAAAAPTRRRRFERQGVAAEQLQRCHRMNVSPIKGECDEEMQVWTPRTHEHHWPRLPRNPAPTFTVHVSLAELERDARSKRRDARDVVRAAADALAFSAVAAAAGSAVAAAVADIADIAGEKRARPFGPPLAPLIDIPDVD